MPIVAEEVIEWVYRSDLPDDAYALRVEGDSMPPLETGDYVAFVANGDYHDKDRVVVANEYGDPIVKRLRIRPDGCQVLVSDNPKYEPIQPNEHYRIIGKVIKAWRELI
jgi:phage repressor protein C with HTH and peptisase S24 domain